MRVLISAVVIAFSAQVAIASDLPVVQNPETQREAEARRVLLERIRELQKDISARQAARAEAERREALRVNMLLLTRQLEAALGVPVVRDIYGRTLRAERIVTVMFRNAEAREILQFLATSTGVDLRFAEGVDARTPLSFEARDTPVAHVFHQVLDAANLSVTLLDGQTMMITARQP